MIAFGKHLTMKTSFYTCLAILAFAGNSILCRLALQEKAIDPASFTAIRLLSGIVVLAVLFKLPQSKIIRTAKGSWSASFMLFLYAIAFSYAYVFLGTGMGALILFATVQMTMVVLGLLSGIRMSSVEWSGVVIAFSGFVYLLLPTLTTPSLSGFILMFMAGVAWAGYTLLGRQTLNPLADTAFNFLRTLPFVIALVAVTLPYASISEYGLLLAVVSGGLTSGIGYALWYAALRGLSTLHAAVVQLLVPVIAAFGGVVFAGEVFSLRLLLAFLAILGGIFLVIVGKEHVQRKIKPAKST